jgi:hypothetical protein
MQPDHAGKTLSAEHVAEQGRLRAHQAKHRIVGAPQGVAEQLGLGETGRQDQLPVHDPRPQPLVDEGIAVSERQRDDGFANGFAILRAVQVRAPVLRSFACARSPAWERRCCRKSAGRSGPFDRPGKLFRNSASQGAAAALFSWTYANVCANPSGVQVREALLRLCSINTSTHRLIGFIVTHDGNYRAPGAHGSNSWMARITRACSPSSARCKTAAAASGCSRPP